MCTALFNYFTTRRFEPELPLQLLNKTQTADRDRRRPLSFSHHALTAERLLNRVTMRLVKIRNPVKIRIINLTPGDQ